MNTDRFLETACEGCEPPGLSAALRVLWLDARGDWDAAHAIAQDLPDPDGARLHAYLHREDGDLGNADYWYRRAAEEMPSCSLDEERRELVDRYLAR